MNGSLTDPKSPIDKLPYVGSSYSNRLNKLGIKTIEDLLCHVPSRLIDYSNPGPLTPGENTSIQGMVTSAKNQYTKSNKKLQLVELKTKSGILLAVWFNQPYLLKTFAVGEYFSLSGKVDWFGRRLSIISPEYEKLSKKLIHTARLLPIYPETAGISSKWLRRRISDALEKVEVQDTVPPDILKINKLLDKKTALQKVHFPQNIEDFNLGKKRLAFDELLSFQIKSIKRKETWKNKNSAHKLSFKNKDLNIFFKSLPFKLTSEQKLAIKDIKKDFKKQYPSNRLLQGDVGSGKTIVAAAAIYICIVNNKKAVLLAPTQILATQHANTLKHIFKPSKTKISLITGSTKVTPKNSQIIIGTHALLNQKNTIKKSALIVIDEQHKFGVKQRGHIKKIAKYKKLSPHILTLSATPIPRSIALTYYGDLSVSTLKNQIKGRQKISSWVVPNKKRADAYKWINKEITGNKSQAFIICPLIEESQSETLSQIKSVKKEYQNIKKIFPNLKVDLLHGKQSSKEKNKIIKNFKNHKSDILVSTPVVEVGIDIPNATIMVIETADRFGLAQLHQLRGRVGRGTKKSYCLLFTDSTSPKTLKRLKILSKTHSGITLSELDLKLRGPGEIFGFKQSGIPELKIASWQDVDLIKAAHAAALEIYKSQQIS